MSTVPRYIREYVDVNVDFDKDGRMLPKTLIWEDGHRYEIDRIKAIQPAPALKAGGQGDRYTIVIEGHERYLLHPLLIISEYFRQSGKPFLHPL